MASELLKVAYANAASNSEVKLIDGASGHTYTILSITICETAGAAETFDLYTMDGLDTLPHVDHIGGYVSRQ